MVRSFRRLQDLAVKDCEEVKAIFDIEEFIEEETSMERIFPSLKTLKLDRPPKLESLCLDPLLDKMAGSFSLILLLLLFSKLLILED